MNVGDKIKCVNADAYPATTPIVRQELGLKARAPHAEVIAALQAKMDEMIVKANHEAQNGDN